MLPYPSGKWLFPEYNFKKKTSGQIQYIRKETVKLLF